MNAGLDIWAQGRLPERVALEGERVAIGRADSNEVSLPFDGAVSRLHAVLERYPSGWCVRDVGSANGTLLNGERLISERLLHPDDEIRLGSTRLIFKARQDGEDGGTLRIEERPPELTRREQDVLVALCRPLAGTQPFTQPATVAEIAAELVVTDGAVKEHLKNLYEKFKIPRDRQVRRVALANEAIARGAIGRPQLHDEPETPGRQPAG